MEEKLPWIRRRLKKTSYRVEKNPEVSWYTSWYHKLTNTIFRNSFKELERNVNELQSEDKLSSLLQGLEVVEYTYLLAVCYIDMYLYMCAYTNCLGPGCVHKL